MLGSNEHVKRRFPVEVGQSRRTCQLYASDNNQ